MRTPEVTPDPRYRGSGSSYPAAPADGQLRADQLIEELQGADRGAEAQQARSMMARAVAAQLKDFNTPARKRLTQRPPCSNRTHRRRD